MPEAESLIARLHADWGEAIGNYDEFRFFTGLRPSEQIALLVTDYDARRAALSVTKARVLRRDKDRTNYHARHSSVTWQLMLGKNLLWVAKQHGHSVEVMLRMYAAWLDGATDSDIHAIKLAMEKRPAARVENPNQRAAISAVHAGTNRARLIVIRPPESPEFGSSLAVENGAQSKPLNREQIKWRRGWDSNPRAGITRPSDFESAPL